MVGSDHLPSVGLSFGPEKKGAAQGNAGIPFTWAETKNTICRLVRMPPFETPVDGCLAEKKFHVRVIDGSLDIQSIGTRGGNELEKLQPPTLPTTVDPIEADLIGCESNIKTMEKKKLFGCFLFCFGRWWMVLSSFTAPPAPWWPLNKRKTIQLYDFGAAAVSGPKEYINTSTKMKGGT